jgi:hypothetical protein
MKTCGILNLLRKTTSDGQLFKWCQRGRRGDKRSLQRKLTGILLQLEQNLCCIHVKMKYVCRHYIVPFNISCYSLTCFTAYKSQCRWCMLGLMIIADEGDVCHRCAWPSVTAQITTGSFTTFILFLYSFFNQHWYWSDLPALQNTNRISNNLSMVAMF